MENYQHALENLRRLDLPTSSPKVIIDEFSKFGDVGWMLIRFESNKAIIRARLCEAVPFSTREQLKYKPQHLNKNYERASTPNKTMFYGAILPDKPTKDEVANARITASLEVSGILRNNVKEGKERITYSQWIITKPITVMAMCYHADFISKSSFSRELLPAYHAMVQKSPIPFQDKSIAITNYIAGEFAKKNISHNSDYAISAIFSELCVKRGLDGILYPSVRADGMGYNIAISPETTDKSLKLTSAGECIIYKNGGNTFVDNETVCLIDNDKSSFKFMPVAPDLHLGEEKSLRRIASLQ